jgi:chlorophyllide a reductase subunit Z
MGLPCTFAIARKPGVKPDNFAAQRAVRERPPLVLFGSYNERMYLAEAGGRSVFIPASFPGAIIRRHTGTPFMGYGGATYIVQEVCNAFFDALFGILPLGTELDRIDATPARLQDTLAWDDAARLALDELVQSQPVLIRISAAKRLREAAETHTRAAGDQIVTVASVRASAATRAAMVQ